jgi:alanine racemase
MDYKLNRAWAEINLDNIAYNINEIKRVLSKRTEIMAVVKADAYGHGVKEVSKILLDNGVSRLAVSMLDEAIQLRREGITVPLMVLGYTDPIRAEEIIKNDITQAVFSMELAEALSSAAARLEKNIKIHIKIDTGMTRIGFPAGYLAVKKIIEISKLPKIIIEGLFTHFASADEADKSYTLKQFETFMGVISELERVGVRIPIKHACNSAGIIEFPQMHMDMVRPGLIIYGMYPSNDIDKSKLILKPAMSLKANVIQVKDVEIGIPISYGRTFRTERESKIATIPIGYADGFTRMLSNKGKMIVNGEFAPVVGRICMDQCMIDVTDVGKVEVGDEVSIIGSQGERSILVEDVAELIGMINYEVVCIIGKRIPRAYIKDGKLSNIVNYLV